MASDVRSWLTALGLEQYASAFADNHVDIELVGRLTDQDLRELGVASLGHRKKILAAAAAPAGQPAGAQTPGPQPAQRRQVTVLFADICRFTEISSRIDAEDLRRLCERFYALADAAIVDAGGSVDKHLGDGVMALFGAPIAHGDDSLRALRAAEDLHAAASMLAREFAEELDQPLQLHIGVAAGEVVAGGVGGDRNRHYTVLGDSVNLAARLVGEAPPGGTVVSDEVRRATANAARFKAVGERPIKGVDKPVALWRLTGLEAAGAMQSAAPFVGRAAERAQLEGIIAATRQSGAGRLVLLRGEPGIGKTRLLEEVRRTALAGGYVSVITHVVDFGASRRSNALASLLRVLGAARVSASKTGEASPGGAVRDLSDLDDPLMLAAACDAFGEDMPAHARTAWQSADHRGRIEASHRLLLHVAVAAARLTPVLIVIEDLHWADDATIEDVARLAAVTVDHPVVLLATTRGEGDPLERGFRELLSGLPLTVMDLGPLRQEEAASLAAQLGRLNGDVVHSCLERAGGNPLFLDQLLRNAAEAAGGDLPGSLRSLVIARVDRLPTIEQEVLQAASVLGQRFEIAALDAVLGGLERQPQAALRAGMLRGEGQTMAFGHALIREGIYLSLLRERRAQLHRRAAAWFADRDRTLHAEHLERAGDAGAAAAYLEAARAERAAYRSAQGVSLADRGLALAADPAVRADLLLLRAEALLDSGEARAAQDAFTLALAAIESPAGRCTALIGLAGARRIIDDLDGAFTALDQAEAIAAAQNALESLSRINHMRGNILFPLGRGEECVAAQEKALSFAEQAGSIEAVAVALGGLGDAEYARGRLVSSLRYFERCVEAARAAGLGRTEVANWVMAAICRNYALDPLGVIEEAEKAVALARRVGQMRAEMIGLHAQIIGYLEVGEPRRSYALAHRAQEIVSTLGALRFEPENLAFLADAQNVAGDREEAIQSIAQALRGIEEPATHSYVGPVVLAIAARLEHDADRADGYLAAAELAIAKGGLAHNHLWVRRAGMDVGWARRDVEMLEHHAMALRRFCVEPMPWADYLIDRALVLADGVRGRRDGEWRKRLARLRATAAERHLMLLDRALADAEGLAERPAGASR